jgi:signal transduction histidine kinase
VLETGQSVCVPDVEHDVALAANGDVVAHGLHSLMAVPLCAQSEVIGAISFGARDRNFGSSDLALAEALGRQAGPAIDDAWHYRELQHAIQLREDVLGTVVHDLKTPLTSIKGHADLLQRQAQSGPLDPKAVLTRSEAIIASVARMAEQIGELVDAARLEAGQQLDLMVRQTDLVALIHRAAAQIEATSSRHTLTVESALPQLVGNWDGPRLERVIGNLLSNAVQYSPDGGDVRVRVALKEDAGRRWATFEVQDNGLGIPAADVPRIFDRYHRGRNVAGRIRGTGIGLAGAKQIVEQHGGRIELDSVEGQGTTFTVLLPPGDAD